MNGLDQAMGIPHGSIEVFRVEIIPCEKNSTCYFESIQSLLKSKI